MTDPRILHIEVSTPQAAMDAFADIWQRRTLERGSEAGRTGPRPQPV
jgi:hypothetical protein